MSLSTHNSATTAGRIRNAITVDVEDYFQVYAFSRAIRRDDWDSFDCRVERNVDLLLGQFASAGARGTFFSLGWIAERYPAMVRRIVAEGHELASHGWDHTRADAQDPPTFREDIRRAKGTLEQIGGVAISGYRAATFSIGRQNLWAFDVLAEEGHRYSSSIYPVKHDTYGMHDAPRLPYRAGSAGLWELPMTTIDMFGRNLPCSGGGYFRLLPYHIFRMGLRRFNQAERQPGIFYTHPWEFDPDQPRVAGAPALSRFRHYVNLDRTQERMEWLLRDFSWGRMDEVFANVLAEDARTRTFDTSGGDAVPVVNLPGALSSAAHSAAHSG